MSRTWHDLRAGLSAAIARPQAAFVLWAIGLVLALPVGLMTAQLVHRVFGHTLIADEIAARFLPVYGAELFASERTSLFAIVPVVVGVTAVWLAVTPWMQGFGLGAARNAQGGAAAHAGHFYGRLLRLWPLTLLWSAAVLGPLGALAVKAGGTGVENWTSERGVFALRLGLGLIVLAVAAWVRGSVALMRAAAVLSPQVSVWKIPFRGIRQAVRQPVLPFVSVASFFGLSAAVTLVGSVVHTHLRLDVLWVLVCGLLLQQATAWLRALMQLALHGAALHRLQGPRPDEGAP